MFCVQKIERSSNTLQLTVDIIYNQTTEMKLCKKY